MSIFARFLCVARTALFAALVFFVALFNANAVDCASNEFEVNGVCIEEKFLITTTNLNTNKTFKFVLSAAGTFYVDWGDGNTEPIIRNDTTPTEYSHTYSSGGVKFIKFGGLATEYNTTQYSNDKDPSGAAIRFGQTSTNISTGTAGSPTLIQSISGSVGSVFPTLGDGSNNNQNPTFFEFCHGCSNLTSVSPTLFSGVTKAKKNLFRSVFDKCSKLVSIPENIFNGVSGSAESMFRSAFYECSALSDLPANLFSGIDGAAPTMFMYTFQGTTGLSGKYIPATLFSGLKNQSANKLFDGVFNKSNLLSVTDGCPAGTSRVYTVYDSLWNNKIACEVDIVFSCTGLEYKSVNECKTCPTGYDDDTADGKTDISDCKITCPAGKWTGEYEKLDYIEASGTQYIDTGYSIPASFTSFEAQFETSSGSQVRGNIGHFAGNQDATSGHAINFKDNKFGLWVEQVIDGVNYGSKITAGGTFNAEERRTVNYKIHGNKRDLIVVGIGSSTNQEFVGSIQSANTYKLFSNGAGTNDKMLEGRIHWFKIYENDNLIFDFIPVRRVSDNAIGMYDQVSGRFFGNDGTGDFVAGSFTTPQIIGGSVCENVGFGHYSGASTTGYGSVSTRNACDPGEITDTETSTSSADCYSNSGVAVCSAGTYLPANSETCVACTAGNWCPGGLLNFSNEDQGLYSCAAEIGTGWTSVAGSDEQTDCYYLISLNKNGYSGNIYANGGTGCSVVADAITTNNAQLKLFYNTECTLPNISFSGQYGNLYAATDSWAATNGVTDVAVITISPTTTTPAVTTYYARKSCVAGKRASGGTCVACGAHSSSEAGNALPTCTCDDGYTADGSPTGSMQSEDACIEIDDSFIRCIGGYYLPLNSQTCQLCEQNNYCSGGAFLPGETNQGITPCPNSLYSPAGMSNAEQCGRILRMENDIVYLRSTHQTTPSLNVDVDNDGTPDFFGNMTQTNVPMTTGSSRRLEVEYNNQLWYVYDDSVDVNAQ